jgi:hypothetical protein
VVRLVGRWWNRIAGGIARRDIWLKTDGTVWLVEARDGRRPIWAHEYPSEREARELITTMMDRSGDRWKDIIDAYKPNPLRSGD